jgi:hypothetical protein
MYPPNFAARICSVAFRAVLFRHAMILSAASKPEAESALSFQIPLNFCGYSAFPPTSFHPLDFNWFQIQRKHSHARAVRLADW